MSIRIFPVEAIGARLVCSSCPRGTTGRLHTLRLSRRFQQPKRFQWTTTGGLEDLEVEYDAQHLRLQHEGEHHEHSSGASDPAVRLLKRQSQNSAEAVIDKKDPPLNHESSETQPYKLERQGLVLPHRLSPPSLHRARYGDMFGKYFQKQHQRIIEGCQPSSFEAAKMALDKALAVQDAHLIFEATIGLVDLWTDDYPGTGLGAISPTTFSEILRCLSPSQFVGRYMDIHMEISRRHPTYVGLQPIHWHSQTYGFCVAFMSRITDIIKARRSVGLALRLLDYKHLLRCARAIGNSKAADTIWRTMERDEVQPDVECFNEYIATKVWSDCLQPRRRQKLTVTKNNLRIRRLAKRPVAFGGFRTGNGGIKQQINHLFQQMASAGIAADEETFTVMIIAFAREGDMDGIKSILKKVWAVDVDALLLKGEDGVAPVKWYPFDSPIRPSEKLLFALAHAFGTNNSIPLALRVVDYFSRNYGIMIPLNVWNELLERAFVLTQPKGMVLKEEDEALGRLPSTAVCNLWSTLVADPYNVKPTMPMYDKVITSLLRSEKIGEAQERMEEARHLHNDAVNLYGRLTALESSFIDHRSPEYNRLERDLVLQRLIVHRSRQYIRRWCRLLIFTGNKSLRRNLTFQAQGIQGIIDRWFSFLPAQISYETATGSVSFQPGSKLKNRRYIASNFKKPRQARVRSSNIRKQMEGSIYQTM